jgi:hypothetical protein
VNGNITAQTLIVQTITSSEDFVTGSTHFGSLVANTHQFTGSVTVSGSLAVNGSSAILTNQTGAMSVATASYVANAVSASFSQTAISASFASAATTSSYSNTSTSASYASEATSASYALTASYASNVPATSSFAVSASVALNAISASYITSSNVIGTVASATSASYALTASYASNVPATSSFAVSASQAQNAVSAAYSAYALTSSYSLAGSGFPFSGSAVITGSLLVTNLSSSGVSYLVADSSGFVTAQTASAAIKSTQAVTSTAGQTSFTITNGYTTGLVDVYVNGTKLSAVEYTDTSGTVITLATGSNSGDTVEFVKYFPASGVTNNALRQQTTFTASAAQTVFSASYTPGLLDVFYNGSRLSNGEYAANNGTFFTLATASVAGDILDVFVYSYQVGAFSGIGGAGVANQISYFNTTNVITGSPNFTISGSTMLITGSLIVSGSGTFTNIGPAVFSGSLTSTSGFTGSFSGTATSASYAANAELLDGKDSSIFATTSSNTFVGNQIITGSVSIADSASVLQIVGNTFGQASLISPNGALVLTPGLYGVQINGAFPDLQVNGNVTSTGASSYLTGSLLGTASTASFALNAQTASYVLTAQTASYVLNAVSSSFATSAITASYADSLTVAGTLTAQTLVVQTITSSIDFVTGSTRFGSILGNTHVFSGSVTMNPGGLFVSSSGLVGIGTITPSNILTVVGGVTSPVVLNLSNANSNCDIIMTSGAGGGLVRLRNNLDDFQIHTNGVQRLTIASTGAATFSSSVTAGTQFLGNSATLDPTSSGNLGAVLQMNASGASSNPYGIGLAAIRNSAYDIFFQTGPSNGGGYRWYIGTSEKMTMSSVGNVGIAVDNPIGQLSIKNQISNGSTPVSSYAATTGVAGQNFFNGYYAQNSDGLGPFPRYFDIVSTGSPDGSNGGSNIRFFTNPIATSSPAVERMRITSGGQVLIGKTTNSARLAGPTVEAQGTFYSGGNQGGYFFEDRSNATYWYGWYSTGNTNVFFYNGNSGTNIASITPSTGVYTALSDVNKKKDFELSTIGLNAILGLKPTLYRMKDEDETSNKHLGFIAQEVKDFIPQAYVEQDDFIGLQDRPIIAALVKAIQEQQTLITALEEKLERNNII